MWSTVGNVASIVAIVGFAITIWQLFALKNSVKKSEQAIREVLDDKEYEKLKHILEATENQLKEVSSLLITVDKQGVNQKSIRERCVNVCSELNKCYISLPSGDSYSNIKNQFVEARNHMESFVDGELKSKSEMKEARAFLENAMEGIKKAEEEFAEKKVQAATRRN